MESNELAKALSILTLARYRPGTHTFSVYVPHVQDKIELRFQDVEDAGILPAPTGGLAADLAVRLDGSLCRVLVTDHDIVFPPAKTTSVLESTIRFNVTNAPPLVAYTEMARDAESIVAGCQQAGSVDVAGVSGALLLLRCFIMGALRVGAWPATTMRLWQQAWQLKGDWSMLPRFRQDAAWDSLAASVSTARQ